MADMSIEQVENAMAQNRQSAEREKAAIQQDKHLTNEGKLAKLAEIKNNAFNRHQDLTKERKAAVLREQQALYDRAFNSGRGTIESRRTLYGMVNSAADAKGVDRFRQQALSTGDTDLLRAVEHVAYDRNYLELLEGADERLQALITFEYDQGIRKAFDPGDRNRQVTQLLMRAQRTAGPGW